MSQSLGAETYRLGGLERLKESRLLLNAGLYAGSVYLAGRAAEGLLRAVIWLHDSEVKSGRKSLDTGHDLRELLSAVRRLGVQMKDEHRNKLASAVQDVGRLWHNNLRYVQSDWLKSHWWRIKEIGGKRTLKAAVAEYYNACVVIVQRCDALCDRS